MFFDSDSQCDIPRPSFLFIGWCDTPRPSATPLREGMGCRITQIVKVLLMDRCRAIPSRRGVAEGRGVSHCRTQTLERKQTVRSCPSPLRVLSFIV